MNTKEPQKDVGVWVSTLASDGSEKVLSTTLPAVRYGLIDRFYDLRIVWSAGPRFEDAPARFRVRFDGVEEVFTTVHHFPDLSTAETTSYVAGVMEEWAESLRAKARKIEEAAKFVRKTGEAAA